MARALKVFRTPIGFHDAYVAAPSRKAALEAWGSDADLFARGMAELVTDDTLAEEPLSHPGQVIRRLRGSVDDHMAELDRQAPRPRKKRPIDAIPVPDQGTADPAKRPARAEPKRAKRKPAPSRARLAKAEAAVEEVQARQARDLDALRAQERELQQARRSLEKTHERDIAKLEQAARKARDAYATAREAWRD